MQKKHLQRIYYSTKIKKHCILIDDEQLDSLQTTAGYSWNEGDSKGKKKEV